MRLLLTKIMVALTGLLILAMALLFALAQNPGQ
jgi:hypothetical protein